MKDERKSRSAPPKSARPEARTMKVRSKPPPAKEEAVERDAARLADMVGANA
jgi:hypothetical protein